MRNPSCEHARLLDKLSTTIGYYWWKRYVAAAFWSNVESPINLTLTLLSTMVSAQAATTNFIPEKTYVVLTFVSVLLTTVNTFYKPLVQANKNLDLLKKWYVLGAELEKILYEQADSDDQYKKQISEMQTLLETVNKEVAAQVTEHQNFFTDLIHLVVEKTCLGDREPWLNYWEPTLKKSDDSPSCWERLFCCFRRRRRTVVVEMTETKV